MIDEIHLDKCLKNAEENLKNLQKQEPEKVNNTITTDEEFEKWLSKKKVMVCIIGTLRFVKTGDYKVFPEIKI